MDRAVILCTLNGLVTSVTILVGGGRGYLSNKQVSNKKPRFSRRQWNEVMPSPTGLPDADSGKIPQTKGPSTNDIRSRGLPSQIKKERRRDTTCT